MVFVTARVKAGKQVLPRVLNRAGDSCGHSSGRHTGSPGTEMGQRPGPCGAAGSRQRARGDCGCVGVGRRRASGGRLGSFLLFVPPVSARLSQTLRRGIHGEAQASAHKEPCLPSASTPGPAWGAVTERAKDGDQKTLQIFSFFEGRLPINQTRALLVTVQVKPCPPGDV